MNKNLKLKKLQIFNLKKFGILFKNFKNIIKNWKKNFGQKKIVSVNFGPPQKLKNKYNKIDFKDGSTFGGSILTFAFDLVTFKPLRNFFSLP